MLIVIIELLVVLLALYLGSRYGSLALGAIAGLGIAVLVFDHGLQPGTPPTDVIYIIIAAVTCAGVLQASGGMEWLVQIAERLIRRHPRYIVFIAPLCTFFLTILVGTGHVMYTLMPIIIDVCIKRGIRPVRPCSVASVASMIAIVCSPISAAVIAFSTISHIYGFSISIPQVVAVTIPSCLAGIMAAALWNSRRKGFELVGDPRYQEFIAKQENYDYVYGKSDTVLDKKISPEAKRAVYIFLSAIVIIVVLAFAQAVLPAHETVVAVKGAKDLHRGVRREREAAQEDRAARGLVDGFRTGEVGREEQPVALGQRVAQRLMGARRNGVEEAERDGGKEDIGPR